MFTLAPQTRDGSLENSFVILTEIKKNH